MYFQNAFYEKIYGKCLVNESGGDLTSNLLVECPEILLAREKQEAKKEAVKEEITPKSDKSQVLVYIEFTKVQKKNYISLTNIYQTANKKSIRKKQVEITYFIFQWKKMETGLKIN